MELQNAINQLSEIHAQISKTEFYRGIRAVPVALTGFNAFLAAFLQPYWIEQTDYLGFVLFWVTVAAINILFISLFLVYDYFSRETSFEQQKARNVLMQFGPTLIAGIIVTSVMYRLEGEILFYLPGLWSLIFSLGVFACRPYFPRNSFWVGSYYLMASVILFMLVPTHQSMHPWGMGLIFGVGQLLTAIVIYWDLERHHD
ncbi:hypothetical protein [Candidatus Parabeggiatoa sp. HSG14]|uniref:hypothetical protein n=1 Tax=Candidatus Parabeggiatoa sp. HSG14 TaxID=3055593 RepID=UPI0025A84615|nr:hypothetical protein [Thiotrichales bacterium HSG14]